VPDARVSSRFSGSQTGLAFCGGQPGACKFGSDTPEPDEQRAHWADRNGRPQSFAEASVDGVLSFGA
jgi:hypothetical protein